MYTFSKRLKILSIILIILGAFGWISSYNASHHLTISDVQEILAEEDSHHGDSHSVTNNEEAHAAMIQAHIEHDSSNHTTNEHHDSDHAEHVLHQMHNRPYAGFYVADFFFMMVSHGILALYGLHCAAQAGWTLVLYRVMEAITY